ncbi:MAG TPA: carboxypeptidase regulatory-like domain-containing protein [Gemmatimonadaceae bacterium]|nr:carboxypeptidase regulatory-like domain-containing protein [Gemmatimonadaceae bacterium]
MRWSKWAVLLPVSVMIAAGARVGAQQAPAGGVTGVVFDSLDDAPLGNASVFLVGTSLSVTTNARGIFEFGAVPAGGYRVAFESPALDAIGLTPNPRPLEVRAGTVDTVALFVPSIATLLNAMCPASRAAGGQSILIGGVHDAATGAPVASATVTLSWSDIAVEKKGIVQTNHVVPAVSATDGSYAVCGIPGDASVMIRAAAGQRASGILEVSVPALRLVRQDITIALGADSTATTGTARTAALAGVVTDTTGQPLADAEVRLAGMPGGVARSDQQGHFRLASLLAGSWDVQVQRIAFLPSRVPVVLRPDGTTTASFVLRPAPNVLDTVHVRGHRPDAFALQEKARLFPGATFLSAAAIDSLHASRVTDILGGVKGVQLVYPDSGGPPLVQLARTRFSDLMHAGICPIEYYVDGIPFDMKNSPDASLHPGDIAAIEVYDGASNIPPEYNAGSSACGVVVIWTKRGSN